MFNTDYTYPGTKDTTLVIDTAKIEAFEKLEWDEIDFEKFESPLFDIVEEYPNAFIPIGDKDAPHFVLRPRVQIHYTEEEKEEITPILSNLYKKPLRIDYRDSLIILNTKDIFSFYLCDDDVYLEYGEYRSLIPAVQEGYKKGKKYFNLKVHTNNPSHDYSLILSFRSSDIDNLNQYRLRTNFNALSELAEIIDANYSEYLKNPYFTDPAN